MDYEVRKVRIASLWKPLLIIFAITGAIVGLFTFVFFPGAGVAELGGGVRALSYFIFIVLYTAAMTLMMVLFALIYNWICPKTKGIVVELKQR